MKKTKVKTLLAMLLTVSMIIPARITAFAEDTESATLQTEQQGTNNNEQQVPTSDESNSVASQTSNETKNSNLQIQSSTNSNVGVFPVQTQSADAAFTMNGNNYATLQAAIDAASSDATITLEKDVTLTETTKTIIPSGKNITLDLSGHTLTYDTPTDPIGVLGSFVLKSSQNNGTLYISSGSIVAEGTSASVTLKSGSILCPTDYGIYTKEGAYATIDGGTIESLYAALTGNNTTGNMNFTVNGGTLTAKQGPAIYMPGQVTLTVTSGTLNGGISLRMGQVNISGGTINAISSDIDNPSDYYSYSGNAWFPDALYVLGGTYTSEDTTYGNSLNLNITGGNFNCTNGQGSAVAIYDLGKETQSMNVSISGSSKLVTNSITRKAYQILSLSDIGVTNPKSGYGNSAYTGKVNTQISGGFFSSEVAQAYCAKNYVPAQSNEFEDAPYTVAIKNAESADATGSASGNAISKDETSKKETTDAIRKEATAILEKVKEKNLDVTNVNLEVIANIKDESDIAEDAQNVKEALDTDKESVIKYLDVSIFLKTTTETDGITQVEKTELTETNNEIPITFAVDGLGTKIIRIAHIHNGEVEFLDYYPDYENGLVTVYMNKFSTLAVIESDTARIDFETNGGSKINQSEVAFGDKLSKPADPTKEGYTFAGWYVDEDLTTAYDFSQEVTEDMVLYAKWTKNSDPQNPNNGGNNNNNGNNNGNNNNGNNNNGNNNNGKAVSSTTSKTPTGSNATVAPKTGDTANVWPLIIVMLLALISVGCTLFYKKKR